MKKILFICVENACRSQVAEAFFNKYSKDARAYSAGSKPAKEIDPKTVEVMKEKGIDLHGKKPSGFQPLQNFACSRSGNGSPDQAVTGGYRWNGFGLTGQSVRCH